MSTGSSQPEWRWLNEHRLTWALDRCPEDQLDDLLDAIDLLTQDPSRPDLTHPMEGTHHHRDRTIALLPHGWVLVYTVYPDGVPPDSMGPSLVIRSFEQRYPPPL